MLEIRAGAGGDEACIWAGDLGPYDLVDLHYKYQFTKNLSASIWRNIS